MGLRTWLGLRNKPSGTTSDWGLAKGGVLEAPIGSPTLAVLGNFGHYQVSTLAKVLRGRWRSVPVNLRRQDWRHATSFIKWSPGSEYRIPAHICSSVGSPIVNDTHFLCDKLNVQDMARRAMGYSSAVDPTTHAGLCVVKSRQNATHDGEIVMCPLPAADPKRVYELVVDNRFGEDEIFDYRVLLVFGEMPVAYVKYRPLATRFSNSNARVTLTTPEALFSTEEIEQIRQFSKLIGLEYGELDILRDAGSGRIYIVDANNTPVGPPRELSTADRARTLSLQYDCISVAFERHCRR